VDGTVVLIVVGIVVAVVVVFIMNASSGPKPDALGPAAGPKVALGVWSETPEAKRAEVLGRGAVVVFGRDYVKHQVELMKAAMERGGGVHCLGFEQAAGFGFPSVPMPFCTLIWALTVPGEEPITQESLKRWMDPILAKAFGSSGPPRSPEMTCILPVVGRTALFMIAWKKILNSHDVTEAARKLEHGLAWEGHRGHWSA
jgi:hypothetical protein